MKFLVIRNDNIGDLICTTPMIRALRLYYPDASISVLVNSYNQEVLAGNTDVDAVYVYEKSKHRHGSRIGNILSRMKVLWQLRQEQFDYVILYGIGLRTKSLAIARKLKPKHIIGYTEASNPLSKYIDMGVPYDAFARGHEAQSTFTLLSTLNIHGEPQKLMLIPAPEALTKAQSLYQHTFTHNPKAIGVHISVRKDCNRWPEENFVALIRALWQRYQMPLVLFWGPGRPDNPMHPGEDDKAARVLAALHDVPILPFDGRNIKDLVAGIALCDTYICSDGGAMHIAAALNKPTLCFFGNEEPKHWQPWGVPHVLLRSKTLDAKHIPLELALQGFELLQQKRDNQGELASILEG